MGSWGRSYSELCIDQDLIPADLPEFELTDDQLTQKIIEQRPEDHHSCGGQY